MSGNFNAKHPRDGHDGRFVEKPHSDPGGTVLPGSRQLAADLRASVGDYRNPATSQKERDCIVELWTSIGLPNQFAVLLEAARLDKAGSDFPTGVPVEPPEHGTERYRRHRQAFTDALIAKVGGEVTNTGGGCTAIEIRMPDGACMLIASDAVIPDGEDTFLGIYDSNGDLYEPSETWLGGVVSVDDTAAEVEALMARYAAEHSTWTFA